MGNHGAAGVSQNAGAQVVLVDSNTVLFGAKPSLKPMLTYCQLDPQEQISVKF